MAVWAIVDYWTKQPINKYVFTTAETRREAWTNFKGKWQANKKLLRDQRKPIPSPRQLANQIEVGYWDIVEITPTDAKEDLEQLELNLESYGDEHRLWNKDKTGFIDYEVKDDHIWLDIIRIKENQHRGEGSRLLGILQEFAKQKNLPIVLDPLTSALVGFFAKNGFTDYKNKLMIWKP